MSPERAIKWSVRWRQFRGFKQDHACQDAGDFLGLTPRYVRGVVWNELKIGEERWASVRRRWWADCDRQAAALRAAADAIIEAKEAEQLADAQHELPLGMANNGQVRSSKVASLALAKGRQSARLANCRAA
jgi:hypothetical protein